MPGESWFLQQWARFGPRLLRLGIALMLPIAAAWLGYEFWRLVTVADPVWTSSPRGAIDLWQRHTEIQQWFGVIDEEIIPFIYPPASYVLLWPMLGWLEFDPARWLWAITSLVGLAALSLQTVRGSGVQDRLQVRFVALIPLSTYAAGATIGNGQLMVHVMPVLIAGLLLLKQRPASWTTDLLAAALVLVALVKPNASAPFFWIAIFAPGRLRPSVLVVTGYLLATGLALCFQPFSVVGEMVEKVTNNTYWGGATRFTDLPIVMKRLGWSEWLPHATAAIMGIHGLWTLRHRHREIWLLMGVAGVVARFVTYHRWYDDLLILPAMVALIQIMRAPNVRPAKALVGGLLLAATWLSLLAPGGLYIVPTELKSAWSGGQAAVWLIAMIFLCVHAAGERRARATDQGQAKSSTIPL